MQLSVLLRQYCELPAALDRDIEALTLDSRRVCAGTLFIAIKGTQVDGRDYISVAITKGATAILVEAAPNETITLQGDIPIIPIIGLSALVGSLAARFYDYPSRKIPVFGVTGTSGKTSCTHFIAQALQSVQKRCGIIGTLGSGFFGALTETGLTTPDAISLQKTLAAFVEQGADAVAMEVSSHSIDQGRVNGIEFAVGIFTNLSQDHLDYHGDMETYAAVKRRFVAELPVKQVVINAEDAYGRRWINELSTEKTVVAYGLRKSLSIPTTIPYVYTEEVALTLQGITAKVMTPWGEGQVQLPLIGQFNLSNALAVMSALCLTGVSLETVLQSFRHLSTVPGRMQTLGGEGKPLVVVDYAHKPDALEKVLQALRSHTKGKLYCVFGCGGDRDRGKRPLMGQIAEKLADRVIITNDNPRHESPEAIAAEICGGFSNPDRVSIELDRSKAIQNSIQWATAEDCVLIAGKGAERYQQFGDEKTPFDDVEQVKAVL